jgi:phosphoserine phosphatase
MERAIIVDLDGTICNIKQRLHHIEGPGKKNWDAFNEDIPFDEPHHHVIELVNLYRAAGIKVLLVTGRFERYSNYTTAWLSANGVGWDALMMRKDGDYRSDYVVKEEIWNNIISPKWEVQFVLDDRDTVVDMWRRNELKCFQVQKGDY